MLRIVFLIMRCWYKFSLLWDAKNSSLLWDAENSFPDYEMLRIVFLIMKCWDKFSLLWDADTNFPFIRCWYTFSLLTDAEASFCLSIIVAWCYQIIMFSGNIKKSGLAVTENSELQYSTEHSIGSFLTKCVVLLMELLVRQWVSLHPNFFIYI